MVIAAQTHPWWKGVGRAIHPARWTRSWEKFQGNEENITVLVFFHFFVVRRARLVATERDYIRDVPTLYP